jgi:hypothetical protein
LESFGAVLHFLSLERLRAQDWFTVNDYDLVQDYLQAVMIVLCPFEKEDPQSSQPFVELFVENIEGYFSWIRLCLRRVGSLFKNYDDAERKIDTCVFYFAKISLTLFREAPLIKAAMQASPTVASIVVVTWAWKDKHTRLPLFMIDIGSDRKTKSKDCCAISDLFHDYAHGSEDAKRLLLAGFSEEGFGYRAAERFVVVAMARAGRMRLASERNEWDSCVVARHYMELVCDFDGFVKLRDPILLSVLPKFPFIEVFVSGIVAFTKRLAKTDGVDPEEAYLHSMGLLCMQIQEWIDKSGVSPVGGICHLVRGGMLPFCLDLAIYAPSSVVEVNIRSKSWDNLSKEITTKAMSYSCYPSVLRILLQENASINPHQEERLSKRGDDTPTGTLWKMLQGCYQAKAGLLRCFEETGGPYVCDNMKVGHSNIEGIA